MSGATTDAGYDNGDDTDPLRPEIEVALGVRVRVSPGVGPNRPSSGKGPSPLTDQKTLRCPSSAEGLPHLTQNWRVPVLSSQTPGGVSTGPGLYGPLQSCAL